MTGASSGIGKELAVRLAKLQAKVVLAARSAEKLAVMENQIRESGGQALSIQTDMAIKDEVTNLIETTLSTWNRIDILISNAGQYIQTPIADSNQEYFERSFDINFYASCRNYFFHSAPLTVFSHHQWTGFI